MEMEVCGCCCGKILRSGQEGQESDNTKGQARDNDKSHVQLVAKKLPEVVDLDKSNTVEPVFPRANIVDQERTSLSTVAEKLALIFEYPYFIQDKKTVFGSSGEAKEFAFCEKCEQALCQLYFMYQKFTTLLQSEGRVLRTLHKIGNEPLVPMLIYDAEVPGTNNLDPTNVPLSESTRSNEHLKNSTLVNVSTRHKFSKVKQRPVRKSKKVSIRLTTRHKQSSKISQESSSSRNSDKDAKAESIETDEESEIHTNDVLEDDYANDPSFNPKMKHPDLKGEPKRRGRKSRKVAKKSRTSIVTSSEAGTENSSNSFMTDSEPKTLKNKTKRRRCLKKEFWIEKAKDDPSKTCDICGKIFLYSRMMLHHKLTVHEGKKPFECQNCGRCFTQNFILKKHTCDYKLAGGDREYLKIAREQELFKWSCEICSKRFKERSALAVHQMNHAGESFKCSQCEKSFRRPDHLKTHVKIVHSEEKKFICSKCGQKFKTSSNLRAHERKHTNPEQKHLCNICGKSIRTLSQMSRHQKTHEDVLPYQCHICGKKFKMKDYLGQHLRKGKLCSERSSKIKKLTNNDAVAVNIHTQDFQHLHFRSLNELSEESGVLSPTMEFPTFTITTVENLTNLPLRRRV